MILSGSSVLLADQVVMQPDQTGQQIKLVLMMVAFAVIVWFLMLKALRPGDKVVSTSGIIGVVLSIKDRSVSIRSADTKLEILKSAVAEVTERNGDAVETKT